MKYKAMNNKQCAKGTKLLEHNRGDGPAGARRLLLFVLVPALLVFFGCASTQNTGKETLKPVDLTLVTGIEFQDNMVKITASTPFIYTIYKPGDPYRIVIELPDVSLGAYTKKIVYGKAGITELIPSQTEPPALMSKLEILLQNPLSYEQEYKNNVLTIKVKEDATLAKSEPAQNVKVTDLLREKEPAMKREARLEPPAVTPEPPLVPQTPLQNATEISGISFEQDDSYVKVLIKGNGSMIPNIFPLDNRIVIDIPDVALNTAIPDAVFPPVKAIRSGKYDDKVRLVLDLKEDTRFDVAAIGDSIVVTLRRPGSEPATIQTAQPNPETTELPESETEEIIIPPVLTGSKCESYLAGKENVNFDFQDQDIVPILRLFADISSCNLFLHPDVKGKATMKFRDVPWNQAFDTILMTFSLGKSIEGNIIRVAPNKFFTNEKEEKVKSIEAQVKAEPLETKIFRISYADVAGVEAAIKSSKILSSRGSINVDKRTSTMLVKDVAAVFPEIDSLLTSLDKSTPQVMIEARIVEVSTSGGLDLGIQWGLSRQARDNLSSIGGFSGLSRGPFTGRNFVVDLPAAAKGAGITFGILNAARTVGLDLQLSALENISQGKIISNPRIVTTDNVTAKIMQGESIPYTQPSATIGAADTTAFKDVAVSIEVTPHITPANSISMVVKTTKEELIEFVQLSSGSAPRTSKIEGSTTVLVEDGETMVIGGMYKKVERDSSKGVPGLMNIPILGWLFKNKQTTEDTRELLIFITPRILLGKH